MRANSIGNLAIPIIASAYAAYMIYEQLAGSYHASTVRYALLLGGAVIALSVATSVMSFLSNGQAAREPAPIDPSQRQRYIRAASVLGLAWLLVLTFDWIGYAIGFFLFSLASLQLLKVRSLPLNMAIPLGTVLVVHFVFVRWLGLPLPVGILGGFV